jgi:anaerobic magnesium-protoporphyrin IX monomethyl ester cyclase
MRVLLINPYYPISETPSPPLGLAYLAAVLLQAGVDVKILDYVVYPYRRDALESVLKKFKPQVAGATAVSMTFNHARQILSDVKAIDPGILTVMGGPHVTFCAQETLKTFAELDAVVIGEGEQTIVELLSAIESTRNFDTVNGIAYRAGSKIMTTAKRKRIKNLDALPFPARHLIPLGRYRVLGMPISLTTSRGCPHKCIFCVGRKMGGAKVRYHSAERVATELQYLANLKFHQINIADDLFTANQHHCLAVCEEILKRKLKINWTSFARVDTVSETLLSKMKAAGCTAVSFGIESANPTILNTIKKGITVQQVRTAIRLCRRVEIRPYASFILGLPGETPQTMKETAEFAASLQQEGLAYGFHILAPFPGTEVRAQSDRLGIRILTDDWSKYDANRAVIETVSVSHRMLDDVVVDWENQYDHYLGHIHENIQNGTATEDEISQFTNLENSVALYDLMMQNQIEACGLLSLSDRDSVISKEKSLEVLIDRITRSSDMDPRRLKVTLQQVVEDGNLKLIRRDDRLRWEWDSFLQVPKMTKMS